MSYTLGILRNKVIRNKLDDESFETSIVDDFINDTQRDIFNTYELPFMEATFAGVLPVGEHIFLMPADCQIIQAAAIISPDEKKQDISQGYMKFRDFVARFPVPENNNPGPITYWTTYNGKLYASQPIDLPYTLEIYYIKRPALLEDVSDVPEIPEEFSELLVLGAFRRVLERNEDYDLAATIERQYGQLLDKMVARYGRRLSSGPIKIGLPNHRVVRRA